MKQSRTNHKPWRLKEVVLNIIAPILLGVAVYIAKAMFDFIPGVMSYHLPDGLWMYAFVWTLWSIWMGSLFLVSTTAFVVAVILEVSQTRWLPGTFDVNDILWYAGGVLLAVGMIRRSGSKAAILVKRSLFKPALSLLTLGGFTAMFFASVAPVNSTFESARMLEEGDVEVAANYSRYSALDTAMATNHNYGGRVGFGISDRVNLKIRYERLMSTEDVEDLQLVGLSPHAHYADVSLKLSLGKGRTALSLPLASYIGFGWHDFAISPRIIHTWTYQDVFDFSVSGVVDWHFGEYGTTLPNLGANVGVGLSSDLDVWALRPEFGIMTPQWSAGASVRWTLGIGLGVKLPIQSRE